MFRFDDPAVNDLPASETHVCHRKRARLQLGQGEVVTNEQVSQEL